MRVLEQFKESTELQVGFLENRHYGVTSSKMVSAKRFLPVTYRSDYEYYK